MSQPRRNDGYDPDPLTVLETRAEHRGYEQGTVRLREIRVRRTREHVAEILVAVVAGIVIGYIAGASRVSAGSPSETVVGSHPPLAVPSVSVPATPSGEMGTAIEGGTATWCAPTPKYCQSWGRPAMLGAMESFRWGDTPYRVRVTHGDRSTIVTVVSHCVCGETLIDLSVEAFDDLAPLSRGRIDVSVETLGPVLTLPPTDLP